MRVQVQQSLAAETARSAQSESQEARCAAVEMQWRAELERGTVAEAKVKELTGLLQLTQLELQCTRDEAASAKAEAARFNQELAHQMVDSDVLRDHASSLDLHVNVAARRTQELAADLAAANETIQTLNAELKQRNAAADELRTALHEAKQSQLSLTAAHHEQTLRLEASQHLSDELNELRVVLVDTEHRLLQSQKELTDCREVSALETSSQCRDLVAQLHAHQERVASLQEKVGALQEALESVQYSRALEVKELSERNDALTRDVQQVRELKWTIAQLEAASEEAAAEYASKLERMRMTELAMEAKHEQGLQALREKEEQFESECLRLTSDLQARARKLQSEATVLRAEHNGAPLRRRCAASTAVVSMQAWPITAGVMGRHARRAAARERRAGEGDSATPYGPQRPRRFLLRPFVRVHPVAIHSAGPSGLPCHAHARSAPTGPFATRIPETSERYICLKRALGFA
jgi:hypothetical protein